MLKPHEFRTVLEYIDKNGSTTMLRMKKDTGLFGTRLGKTLQAHPDIFILTENYQKVEINRDGVHQGSISEMVLLYERREQRKQKIVWLIGGGIFVVILLLLALIMLASSGDKGPRPEDIAVPLDTAP